MNHVRDLRNLTKSFFDDLCIVFDISSNDYFVVLVIFPITIMEKIGKNHDIYHVIIYIHFQ